MSITNEVAGKQHKLPSLSLTQVFGQSRSLDAA